MKVTHIPSPYDQILGITNPTQVTHFTFDAGQQAAPKPPVAALSPKKKKRKKKPQQAKKNDKKLTNAEYYDLCQIDYFPFDPYGI